MLVLEVVRVRNLARSPNTLVGRVVNVRRSPLALVVGVLLHGLGPGATSRHVGALGVRDSRGNPVTIFLVIPVFGLLSLGVRDGKSFILKPVFGLGSLLIDDLERRVLIPVLRLLSLRVGNAGLVNPVLRLLVVGVVNLLLRVDGRGELVEEATVADDVAAPLDGEGVVGLDNQGVELGGLLDGSLRGSREVLLLVLAGLGVLVVEDEVHLVGGTALVGTEHNNVRGGIAELILVESLGVSEELQVGTTALESLWKAKILES